MEEEYIIVSKKAIEKRIEELEEEAEGWISDFYNKAQIDCLKQILSQSTPLIPVIEDAFDAAKITYKVNDYGTFGYENKQDYISNLKLDI